MWGELAPPTAPPGRRSGMPDAHAEGLPTLWQKGCDVDTRPASRSACAMVGSPGEIQVGGMGTGRVGCSRWMTLSE